MPTEDPIRRTPTPTVGVVCLRGDQVLLIKRGNPPRQGQWSLPGGRLEWGETTVDAALRELKEETGVEAQLLGLIEVVDGVITSRTTGEVTRHYIMIDYAARWLSGEPVAGDDAVEARFVSFAEAESMVEWSETVRIILAGRERFGA
ncbi:8-oxo-dGTP diphosphatase [Caulobacter ginsengisoli]|uniref:8-oxo-dGTP diphosphatase n=1 Tax=Caulobacter ginsengisoli TaxID=400775 RepID=A0ABU0IXG2_9CAUL|nr:NUDIX hydrolase [Caulobacter ginsengisoli]MDQ0466689.1 8-oxo-dGTP diphosphatase [Caulobacter ginsengisoli]